ncbi:hypothetical protein N5J06_12325 [Ralstonia sp. CHL-2022]|uniref:Secreted protein n=1 Tax=Ralstonia mojiangensis TaxID=2953895 RepID=A0ABT2LAP6_9RALS|nr:hypothetical protein [Ralstonia mojiangensis]MCT7298617.1 hypothetical protein [Ralstonia mojiangensis]MCT7311739.1 hypothetical protein [Ralstonia mojiangensis]
MNLVRTLVRLVFAVPQGFAITLDVAVLSAQFTVLLAALHVSLMLHTLRTFMIMVFRMWRRHGLRKGCSTGECKQRGKQGVFVFHGVAPLELS